MSETNCLRRYFFWLTSFWYQVMQTSIIKLLLIWNMRWCNPHIRPFAAHCSHWVWHGATELYSSGLQKENVTGNVDLNWESKAMVNGQDIWVKEWASHCSQPLIFMPFYMLYWQSNEPCYNLINLISASTAWSRYWLILKEWADWFLQLSSHGMPWKQNTRSQTQKEKSLMLSLSLLVFNTKLSVLVYITHESTFTHLSKKQMTRPMQEFICWIQPSPPLPQSSILAETVAWWRPPGSLWAEYDVILTPLFKDSCVLYQSYQTSSLFRFGSWKLGGTGNWPLELQNDTLAELALLKG